VLVCLVVDALSITQTLTWSPEMSVGIVKFYEELHDRWAEPYYMWLMASPRSFAYPACADLLKLFQRDSCLVDRTTVWYLLVSENWRQSIVGSWFAGAKGWTEFRPEIGGSLLASRTCYVGKGYCFALARFADDMS
jgi:hypothetical protein